MLNTIYEEKIPGGGGKKIKIKMSKKEGMKDSQVIFQTLAESRIIMG